MPKLKTHKGAKRRFNITGTGKIMRMKGGKSHFRRRKTRQVKGMFDEMVVLDKADRARIRRMIPYGIP